MLTEDLKSRQCEPNSDYVTYYKEGKGVEVLRAISITKAHWHNLIADCGASVKILL